MYNSTIKPKEKACKGTGKAKGFGCGEPTLQRVYGLGITCKCYQKWLLNSDNGSNIISAKRTSAKKQVQKSETKKQRAAKLTIKNWKGELHSTLQLIARLIDIGQPCIARGEHGNMHGGHIISKGSNLTASFNLHNIHRQLAQSNTSQREDIKLRDGVAREYGEDYYNFISSFSLIDPLHCSNLDYMDYTRKAKKVAKRLQKEGRTFNKTERIEQRNIINQEIGVYTDQYAIYIVS
jgi:hypothetical protein